MSLQPRYRKGDHIGGRYLVHQALLGGMGEVYLCLGIEENHPYALKTFQTRYLDNSRIRELFAHEVGIWVAMEKHPNIVRCFYMETLDNQPFMRLEWVAGEEGRGDDLRSWLRHGPLDLRTALDFTIDICRGLIHANQKQPGIVHRDLKPENILIAEGRIAKITDFGLASLVQQAGLELAADDRAGSGRQTMIGSKGVVGTPPYMAPEQWRGEPGDVRTDIYAVGCILYELLTGSLPYRATALADYRRLHTSASLPIIPTDHRLPEGLEPLLMCCLAKQPQDRFASAAALLDILVGLYESLIGIAPCAMPAEGTFTVADYSNRGCTYHNLGRYPEALNDFNRAICLDPADVKTYNNRGITYHTLGRSTEALSDFNRAICLNRSHAKAYNNRGIAYQALGRSDDALADYTHAISLAPIDAKAYVNRGNTYYTLGRYDEALADYTRAVELNPSNAAVYNSRGLCYASRGHSADALADYTRAITFDPVHRSAYYNRGNTYQALNYFEEALADYTQAISFDPAYTDAYVNRGTTYGALNRFDKALADFSLAVELDPADATVYNNRGNIYGKLGRFDEALADYTRAITLSPSEATLYNNRGLTHDTLGHLDEALADFGLAIALDPTDAKAYANRGTTYATLGRYEEALADYTRAIARNPAATETYLNIGVLFSNQGKYREALPYFQKAAQLGDPRGVQHAIDIGRRLGIRLAEEVNLAQEALNAFQHATSLTELRQAVAQFPFMTDSQFIAAIEQVVVEHRPTFEQRLSWLREIAGGQP